MAHTLDGCPVTEGAQVYDVALGVGRVSYLAPTGTFNVSFSAGRTGSYNNLGHDRRFLHRTLFWHDPIVGPPPKDSGRWHYIRCILQAAMGAALDKPAGAP